MTDWSMDITALAGRDLFTEDQIADLGKAIDRGVAIGFGPYRLTATFTIEDAPSAQAAIVQARGVWRDAARAAGIRGQVVETRARTYEELERELLEPALPELVGVAEAARTLGVSKQRIMQLAEEGRLPEPVAELASGRVWTRASIEHFDSMWKRRPGRPPKDDEPSTVLDLIEALKESVESNQARIEPKRAREQREGA